MILILKLPVWELRGLTFAILRTRNRTAKNELLVKSKTVHLDFVSQQIYSWRFFGTRDYGNIRIFSAFKLCRAQFSEVLTYCNAPFCALILKRPWQRTSIFRGQLTNKTLKIWQLLDYVAFWSFFWTALPCQDWSLKWVGLVKYSRLASLVCSQRSMFPTVQRLGASLFQQDVPGAWKKCIPTLKFEAR